MSNQGTNNDPDDILAPIITTALETVSFNPEQATPTHNVQIQLFQEGHMSNSVPIIPAPAAAEADPEADRRALVVMEREHMKALGYIKKIEKDLDTATLTIATLENQQSTGILTHFIYAYFNPFSQARGAHLDELKQVICSNMQEGFQTLELGFSSKVGVEVRAELVRHTDRIMTELGVLHTVKSVSESCHTKIGIVNESLMEASASNNLATKNIHDQIGTLATKTQMSAATALLTGALKVCIFLNYSNFYLFIFRRKTLRLLKFFQPL